MGVEHHRLLKDDDHPPAHLQFRLLRRARVHAVEEYDAGGRLIQQIYETQEGRLAGATGTYQRRDAVAGRVQVDATQDGVVAVSLPQVSDLNQNDLPLLESTRHDVDHQSQKHQDYSQKPSQAQSFR